MPLRVLHHQPLKGLYVACEVLLVLFIWIPLWALLYVPRWNRPRRSWDIKRGVLVKLIKHFGAVRNRVGEIIQPPTHLALVPDAKHKGVWIEPIPSLILGDIATYARAAGVEPLRIPGYWIDKFDAPPCEIGAPPRPGEKIVYGLHGGAYVAFSGYPGDMPASILRNLLKHCASVQRAFSLEYRLSAGPPARPNFANPFPAALLDAIAGYDYLVNTVGADPQDIIVEGDSAGGNLALALTRYLVENRAALQAAASASGRKPLAPPGALLLYSPWTDLSTSHERSLTASAYANRASDYVLSRDLSYGKSVFTGPHGFALTETCAYVSPASLSADVSFRGFPRTLIVAGGAEVLVDSIRTLVRRMSADMGEGAASYHEAPDGVHDFQTFSWHQPEAREAYEKTAGWVAAG